MIISISGDPGSGKSTIANKLSEALHYKSYYVGGMRREFAKKRGLTLAEYNKVGETDPSTDTEVDEWQKELGEKEDDFVIQGRTSHYFIPHAVKIYLKTDEQEGARRIFEDRKKNALRENEDSDLDTLDDVLASIREREKSDHLRYKKHFNYDMYQMNDFDLVLDTTNLSIEEVYEKVLAFIKGRQKS